MMRNQIPQAWLRACREGRSAKWIAREIVGDEKRWKEIHRALLGAGAYIASSGMRW